MTRVLITGGTGFIGSRLALKCVKEGELVRVLGQKNTPAERLNQRELESKGIEVVDASVTDRIAMRRACSGVDIVYHLAAAQHEANVPDSHYYEVNVEGTRNTLDAAVEARVGRFVHGSTIGVYGIGRDEPVGDDSPLRPDNIYGVTKLAGEEVVQTYFDKLAICVVRISETYGPGDRRLLKLFKGIHRGRFVRIGPGRNLHHPVHVDDLVEGLRLAAVRDGGLGKTFVLAGPRAVTTDEMIMDISKALNREPPRVRVPLWPLLAVAVVLEGLLRPLGVQPPLHRRRMNFFVKSFRFDGRAAQEAIGYQASVDFPEGAARTAAWYAAERLL